jgi:hypothetical protein
LLSLGLVRKATNEGSGRGEFQSRRISALSARELRSCQPHSKRKVLLHIAGVWQHFAEQEEREGSASDPPEIPAAPPTPLSNQPPSSNSRSSPRTRTRRNRPPQLAPASFLGDRLASYWMPRSRGRLLSCCSIWRPRSPCVRAWPGRTTGSAIRRLPPCSRPPRRELHRQRRNVGEKLRADLRRRRASPRQRRGAARQI